MRNLDNRKNIDLSFTIIIAFFFSVGLVFSMFNFKASYENYIMFLILMIVTIVTYYTNITLSLIITLVVDFTYISFQIYQFIILNKQINVGSYFWIVAIIISACLTNILSRNITSIQDSYYELEQINEELVMIDSDIGIRNLKAFINEVPIYMSMAKRNDTLKISILTLKIKYSKDIIKILGEKKYTKLLKIISKEVAKELRIEDRKYILSDEMFAYILITDSNGAKIIRERLRKSIAEEIIKNETSLDKIKIDIQMGIAEYLNDIDDPIELLKKAEDDISYDV